LGKLYYRQNLGKIKANLGKIKANLGKIEAKFEKNDYSRFGKFV